MPSYRGGNLGIGIGASAGVSNGASAGLSSGYGGAPPDPSMLNRALLDEARAKFLEKQTEALEKQVAIGQKSADAAAYSATKEISTKRLNMFGTFVKNIGLLIKNMLRPIGIILKDLSPYIALGVVIWVVFMGKGLPGRAANTGASGRRRDSVFNSVKTPFQRFKEWLSRKFAWLAPGYRYRQFMRMFSFLGGSIKTVPRPRMVNGRCDNEEWKELGGDGRPGLCARTFSPKEIQWTFDSDKMPELNKMPEVLYNEKTNQGRRLQVTIPWALQGTFYVPQCSRAKFSDGTSAAHLFTDEGMTCRKKEIAAPRFTAKYRPKNASSKDDYATANDPKC